MLDLILFLLPGFCSIVLYVASEAEIKQVTTDYWIFLCLSALISGVSLYISDLTLDLLRFLYVEICSYHPVLKIDGIVKLIKLNHKMFAGRFSSGDYIFSFLISRLLIEAFTKFISFVDGTEDFDVFIEKLIVAENKNLAMITLKSNKVYVGPIVSGDVHKKGDNKSITIIPFFSGHKSNGKLHITTENIKIRLKQQSKNTQRDINIDYEAKNKEMETNIMIDNIDYISKFIFNEFLGYVANKKIVFSNENLDEFLSVIYELKKKEQK
ncbi:hypothetical protein BALOs_2971 [Halobacteriovorax sp. BALOs_7]|uniref:hypothetical protein n=1 Tax=Halobacteriovorax sp. BALOs_7 TaxID=2109558 RepID=UPI000EB6A4C8|nr:hypothetical protein [Halobacteriovorax sp. BALOs_7]AYF45953.1 hypothetical protein BALOs_2971 [Halobacteriovorax sp. BALOs_7]